MNRVGAAMLLLVLVLRAGAATAGNGLYDIGYGPESSGLGAADVALARDTFALNTNPAGLTQVRGQIVDLLLEPFSLAPYRHKDSLGNDDGVESPYVLAFGGGYASRLEEHRDVVAGIGLFCQGGIGFAYDHFKTPFMTEDELSAISSSIKIAPGFGWQIDERWSVGASLGILYSSARQKFFPHTSAPGFNGFRSDGLSGISFNYKVGTQFRPTPGWTLGLVYTSKAKIRLENGTMHVDHGDGGLGIVEYDDAKQTGLSFPQEVNLGVMHRFDTQWMVITELTWLEWSESLKSTRVSGKKPENPAAPATFSFEAPLDWKDQWVMSAGLMYQWTPDTAFRLGFSHGRNPVPDRTLNATLPVINRTAVTVGGIHSLGSRWLLNATFAMQLPEDEKYDSAFTGASSEHAQVFVLYVGFSRRW